MPVPEHLAGGDPMTATIDPARATVGAMLLLPLDDVRQVLAVVEDTDPDDPRLRAVLGFIRALAEEGRRPDAITVLSHARASGEVRSSSVTPLAVLLTEVATVEECPVPLAVGVYARALVEHAVRRRITEAAERLRNVADTGSGEGLHLVVEVECAAMVRAVSRLAVPVVVGGAR